MEERNTIEIESYLDGSLEGPARQAFEARLKAEPELAAQLALHQEVELRLEDFHKEEMKAEWKQFLDENAEKKEAKVVRFPMRVIGIAASVLVLLGATWWFLRPASTDVLADQYWNQTASFSYTDAVRSTDPSEADEKLLEKAFQQYNQADYNGTLNSLSSLGVKTESAILLEGAAQFQSNNLPAASTAFRSILDDPSTLSKDEAKWYLALIYLKQKNKAAAQKLLEEIVAAKSWNFKSAEELLAKL